MVKMIYSILNYGGKILVQFHIISPLLMYKVKNEERRE